MGKKFFVREQFLPSRDERPQGEMSFSELRDLARQQVGGENSHDYRREDSTYWRPVSEVLKAESESDLDELVKRPARAYTAVIGHISLERPISEQEKARYAAKDAARAGSDAGEQQK